MARTLEVKITGDARGLERVYSGAEKKTSSFGKSFGGLKVGALAAAGGVATAAVAIKGLIDKATESEVAQRKLEVAVNNAGISYKDHAKQIDAVIQKHSMLTGIDDEELSDSFANMIRTTKNVNEAFKLNALAADISRTKNISLASAASLVARVYNGSFTGAKRLGIAYDANTTAVDRLKASHEKFAPAQLAAAKAADAMANRQKVLTDLTKAFGGQAEATATSQQKLGVAWENIQEKLGAKLLPLFDRLSNWLLANEPRIEAFAKQISDEIGPAFDTLGQAFTTGMAIIEPFVPVLEKVGRFMVDNVLAPAKVLVALLNGDWTGAWNAAKQPVLDLVDVLSAIGSTVIDPLIGKFTGLKNWVSAMIDDIVGFFTRLPGRLAATLGDLAATALSPFQAAFSAARNWVNARIDDIVGFFTRLPGRLAATVGSLVSAGLSPFETAFTTTSAVVRRALGWIVDRIENIKQLTIWIGTAAVGFFEAFRKKLGPIVDGLMAILRPLAAVIGAMVSAVKWLIDNIGKIPKPDLTPGFNLPDIPDVPGIPGIAKGGIVRHPTLAMVGEAGPESGHPTEPRTRTAPEGSGGGSVVVNVHVAGSVRAERDLAEAIAIPVRDALKRHQRMGGALGLA